MPNFNTLFPSDLSFGTASGQVATWSEGDNTDLIPSSKLPNIEIGNTFIFSSTEATITAALAEFYADATNLYHQGDIAVVTYDSGGTPLTTTLIYTGMNQTAAGASVAGDWTTLSAPGSGVTSVIGGAGINASGGTGAVTLNNDLNVASAGTPINAGFLTDINFVSGFTIAVDDTTATQINITPVVTAPGAYTVNSTPAADAAVTLVANSVQVLPGATIAVTHALPTAPIPVGTWIKIVNLTGRTDTVISRSGQPIQGATTDLVLDDATANFELIYINTTTGWAVMGAN